MLLRIILAASLLWNSGVVALPNLSPLDCGNGIYCSIGQTCMSNTTGAGLLYACSPISNAVRCMDARFSCPPFYTCIENSQCAAAASNNVRDNNNNNNNPESVIDGIVNVDAHHVAEERDFGSGIQPLSLSICGPITTIFRLPNFCSCNNVRFGSQLTCSIGLQNYISIGASAQILPCASPASFGYRAWASLLGVGAGIGQTWVAQFTLRRAIPGASFDVGVANAGAQVELNGDVSRFILSTRLAIGACASIGVGPFSREICNPSMLRWLPVTVINGPRFDFSRFC